MSSLKHQKVFEQNVAQTTDITLAGQTDGAPTSVDHVVILEVSKELLSSALTWSGEYVAADFANAREESFPTVTFDPSILVGAAGVSGTATQFKSVDSDLLDAPNALIPTLQGQFKAIVAGFTGLSWSPANVPLEAVIKVVNNPMDAELFTATLSADPVTPTSTKGSNAVDLYEQAVAADKTKTDGADFVDGDSISMYIKYTLTKKRKYHLDSATGTAGGASASADVAGLMITEGDEETSEDLVKVYEFKFVATA